MLFLLHGGDTYRSRQKLNQFKEKFKQADKGRVNMVVIDANQASVVDICKELTIAPFLHKSRMIIIENILQKKNSAKQASLAEILGETKIPESSLIFFWEGSEGDKRTKLFQLLNQPKGIEKFEPLVGYDLEKWITEKIKERGGVADFKVVRALAGLVGNDLWQMTNEIDKLIAYAAIRAKNQQTAITIDDVNLLVKGKFDDNIFNLVDAISNKNKKLAVKLMDDQIASGANEIYLLTMLIRQFRILLQIKEFIVLEDQPFLLKTDPSLKKRIAEEVGIHPFVVQKTIPQIKNFTLEELKNIYQQLIDIEVKIKTGAAKPRVLFDLFLSKIAK